MHFAGKAVHSLSVPSCLAGVHFSNGAWLGMVRVLPRILLLYARTSRWRTLNATRLRVFFPREETAGLTRLVPSPSCFQVSGTNEVKANIKLRFSTRDQTVSGQPTQQPQQQGIICTFVHHRIKPSVAVAYPAGHSYVTPFSLIHNAHTHTHCVPWWLTMIS